jgi:hypothetical protein
MNKSELPIYEVVINDDVNSDIEVDFVALVDRPAIKKMFLAFSDQDGGRLSFAEHEDRRIISGAIILADTPIYRKHPQTGKEFYTVFPKETIYKIVQKFHKKGYQQNVNLMHDENRQLSGVTMFESFITDSARGIKAMQGFEDAPEGSWFGSFLVEDDSTWNLVKEGKVRGFSVEGLLAFEKVSYSEDETLLNQLRELLNQETSD